uniref:EIF-4F 25 kDa subunit n=1 Tax=Hemiselmis andersenii TaxID=464988 RepID=A0A6U4ILI6_HEMAN|mmetsp:Transcript_25822/g.59898  ORF Transcript_25822/g.59898 Transcript_25822/m.59898 type:complete len:232 (+) Transcript_25822:189-884(+)|eukprot:CAMPEP_0114130712 /NCGR_PEP_ID=MMETSP0043_2-20121206/12167_1 /TAXON_ID=464988 /ORGANISM="Hemiselmis andersenii, Strain CCMP644" /LENGTH=231 /DNA_ID=CAMNT_0001224097 /DNA_START=163 /DNA_END=858 /DNA_ORIENTATION=-
MLDNGEASGSEPEEEREGAGGRSEDTEPLPAVDLSVKHPLQNAWVLWFDNPVKRLGARDWSSNLKKVATFDMVEDFWGVLNNVRPPSRLNPGSNYHIFKSGIEPMWEHVANQAGGKWTYSIPKKDGKKLIDDLWLYTILAMIGENFDCGHELCGAVISLRKAGDRVAVWTRSANDEKSCMEIGRQFKVAIAQCMQSEVPEGSLEYQVHDDALQSIKDKTTGAPKKSAKYTL